MAAKTTDGLYYIRKGPISEFCGSADPVCPLTLIHLNKLATDPETKTHTGKRVIVKLSDNQCYLKFAVKDYVERLICMNNLTIDHANFVLPTRAHITPEDLDKLGINTNFEKVKIKWGKKPMNKRKLDVRNQAQSIDDEAEEADLRDDMNTLGEYSGYVNAVTRWGIRMGASDYYLLPQDQVDNLDTFFKPADYDESLGPFDSSRTDEFIEEHRDTTKSIPWNHLDARLMGQEPTVGGRKSKKNKRSSKKYGRNRTNRKRSRR
jgi:hypothetical protein